MTAIYSVLDKVAGVRVILAAAKRVQEARPDASVHDVRRAITIAVLGSLEKLAKKPLSALDAKAVLRLASLRVAESVLTKSLDLIADPETTRELNADERDAFAAVIAAKVEKREAAKVEKAKTAPVKGEKAAAKPVKADKRQMQLADV